MRHSARTRLLALAIAIGSAGCFSLQHELPPNAYFGTLPRGATGGTGVTFDDQTFKNWALAGLLPYTSWSTSQLLAEQPAVRDAKSIQIREIETVFSPFDVAVSIVPGAFYGYYVWATRTVHVTGIAQPGASK